MFFSDKAYEARKSQALTEDRRLAALHYVARLVEAGRLNGLNSDRLLGVAAKAETYLATGIVPTDDDVLDG